MPLLLRTTVLRGLGLFVLLAAHLAVVLYFYPIFLEEKGPLLKIAEMAGGILAGDAKLAAKSEWGFLASQQYFKFANTLGAGAAVIFAAGAVAGESGRGTLEIYLARPVSRARLFVERYLAGAAALLVPLLASAALFEHLARWTGVGDLVHTTNEQMLRAACYEGAFLMMFYAAAYALSVVSTRPLSVVLGLLFFTIAQYALYLVPEANAWSVFQWTDVETFVDLERRWATPTQWLRPLAVTAVLTLAAWIGFRRRPPY